MMRLNPNVYREAAYQVFFTDISLYDSVRYKLEYTDLIIEIYGLWRACDLDKNEKVLALLFMAHITEDENEQL